MVLSLQAPAVGWNVRDQRRTQVWRAVHRFEYSGCTNRFLFLELSIPTDGRWHHLRVVRDVDNLDLESTTTTTQLHHVHSAPYTILPSCSLLRSSLATEHQTANTSVEFPSFRGSRWFQCGVLEEGRSIESIHRGETMAPSKSRCCSWLCGYPVAPFADRCLRMIVLSNRLSRPLCSVVC